jgi:hypothetical protein
LVMSVLPGPKTVWNMLAASACAENNARHGVQFLAGTSSQLLAAERSRVTIQRRCRATHVVALLSVGMA